MNLKKQSTNIIEIKENMGLIVYTLNFVSWIF